MDSYQSKEISLGMDANTGSKVEKTEPVSPAESHEKAPEEQRVPTSDDQQAEKGHSLQEGPNPRLLPQLAASAFMAINGLRAGFVGAYNTVGIPNFMEDPNRPFNLTIHDRSFFASSYSIGALFGEISSGTVSRTVGQKMGTNRLMIILIMLMNATWLPVIFPINSVIMIASRIFHGFIAGIFITLGQIYTTEIAHKSVRGFLLSTIMIWMAFGQLLCFILGALIPWRPLAVASMAIPTVFAPFLFVLPTSPTWLVKRGLEEEALKALKWLRGGDYNCQGELDDIKLHLREAEERQPTFRSMMTFSYLKPFFLATALVTFRQFSGYFPVTFFTVVIFKAAKSSVDPYIATIIIGAVVLVCTILNGVMVDRIGRKFMVITASVIMAMMHSALGVYFYYENSIQSAGLGWLPLATLIVFVASFSLGVASLQFLILGELLPVQIKNQSTGFILAVGSLMKALAVHFFEYTNVAMGIYGTFWGYAVSCTLLGTLTMLALPETKGRTLRDIEEQMTRGSQKKSSSGIGNSQSKEGEEAKDEMGE